MATTEAGEAGGSGGLVEAFLLDGRGGGRRVGWREIEAWAPEAGPLWAHLDRTAAQVQEWLERASGLDPIVRRALLAEETRPRSVPAGEGLLVFLRGVNLNPGNDPEDMVSIRLWIDARRVISLRNRRLMATRDLAGLLEGGRGPREPGGLLAALSGALVERMGPVIEDLEEEVDGIEERVIRGEHAGLRSDLARLRRKAILLRRYLAPQRDALARLVLEPAAWLDAAARSALREVTDRVTRHVEELDTCRDRATVVQEELLGRMSEQMNQRMFVLSMVAAIFLPLGLLTGLLGVNVAGIPGSEDPRSFLIVSAVLVAAALFQIWLYRRLKWM